MSEECKFCAGEWMESDGLGEGEILPLRLSLSRLVGKWPTGHGVHLDKTDGEVYLLFDNSCGEYAEGAIRIRYCPFCGKEIET